MDELEKSAATYSSHLSKTGRDWAAFMTEMLTEMGDEIPSLPSERYALYKKHKVPESVYLEFDADATNKALRKIYGKS